MPKYLHITHRFGTLGSNTEKDDDCKKVFQTNNGVWEEKQLNGDNTRAKTMNNMHGYYSILKT